MAHAIAARSKARISRPFSPGDSGGTGGNGRERGAIAEGAVVVTVTVTLVGELPTVAGFGETVQAASDGAPLQVNETDPVIPPSPPKLKVKVAGEPGVAVAEVEEPADGANEKSWPVPLKATLCGLPLALSVNERLPDAAPPAVGVKVTATVHVAAAATGVDVAHVVPEVAIAKGVVAVIAVNVRLALPVFFRVTVSEGLVVPTDSEGKGDGVDKLTEGPVPVPDRVTVWVLPATPVALSVMVNVPVSGPAAVGLKVTLIVQEPPPKTLPTQLSFSPKSVVVATAVMASVTVPVLLRVIG